jgi:hypothetical protein
MLIGGLTALSLIAAVKADYVGTVVELVDPVAEGWDALGYDASQLDTYRVYACFSDDLGAVGSVEDCGAVFAVEGSAGSGFFNSALGGDLPPNPIFAGVLPDVLWDTFVSIGEEVGAGPGGVPLTQGLPGFHDQAGGMTHSFTLARTGWGVAEPLPPQSQAFEGRVLLAQFTGEEGASLYMQHWVIRGYHDVTDHGSSFSSHWYSSALTPPLCPDDLDGGGIGFTDLTRLLSVWGEDCPGVDLDGNGTVGFADLSALLASWGSCR